VIASGSRFEDEIGDLIGAQSTPLSDLSGQHRLAAGLLLPRQGEDVMRIVQAAKRHHVKLHVVSCGRNWGFGSTLPPEDGVWILNLNRLNRVHSYEPDTGTVRIEPGVTQINLFRELDRLGGKWFFNVTGAGHSTSVLGNALERGIGYHGQRQHDLLELEVLTGRGDVIHTRLNAHHGAAPLGLDLTQLFVQSSFGIVISAKLRLLRRTKGGGAAIVRLRDATRVDEFVRAILDLKHDGAIAGVPHLANRERIITTLAPWLPREKIDDFSLKTAVWTAALPISGCREMTQAAFDLIRDRLASFCEVETIFADRASTSDDLARNPMVQLQQLASGYPSNLALPGVEWTALGTSRIHCTDPESVGAGLIHVTPSIAASAPEITRVVGLVEEAAQALGLKHLPMTVNIVDQTFAVLVISIGFPAAEANVFRHKARSLEGILRRAGFMPYRIGLGQEDWISTPSTPARRLYHSLKTIFDPKGILTASKYEAVYERPKHLNSKIALNRQSTHLAGVV
jgi:4-cresol dehydrogenase (hydroxylating) flavoprotein subunit